MLLPRWVHQIFDRNHLLDKILKVGCCCDHVTTIWTLVGWVKIYYCHVIEHQMALCVVLMVYVQRQYIFYVDAALGFCRGYFLRLGLWYNILFDLFCEIKHAHVARRSGHAGCSYAIKRNNKWTKNLLTKGKSRKATQVRLITYNLCIII